jgi:hypothetical protein
MSSPYEGRHAEDRAGVDADQVELSAVRFGSVVVDSAADDERISGAIDDLDVAHGLELEPWQELDLRQDVTVGGALKVLIDRKKLLGDAYPFDIDGVRLIHRSSVSGMYEFCLAISNAQSIVSKPYVVLPRLFERTTVGILKRYFGEDTKAFHLGWPRTPKSRFKHAVAPLQNGYSEWVWGPEIGLPEDPDYLTVKDETVDFVIIKKLLDSRGGRFYVLGQCACGNDWPTKLKEPNLEQFKKWFRPDYLVTPVNAFTTPFLLGAETLRETARRSKAIVFDRARLVAAAERSAIRRPYRRVKRALDVASQLVFKKGG